jgi:hypothetical protein
MSGIYLTLLLPTRDIPRAGLRRVADAALHALLAQLVEDAVRMLEPHCRDQPVEVVSRRLDVIFDELVRTRARRNEVLARLLGNPSLSASVRGEMRNRVFERLRRAVDTSHAG